MRAFYAYLIHERKYGEDTITKDDCLYQQFLVDAFANIEEDRLDYIRANQNDLRTELYQGINEAVLRGDVQGSTTGKIIVPSSLTGSPRYMINNYQDVMAICRTYGNLDLFITFTCNTNWLEIQRELRKVRVYKHEDNPDIITRVLRTKLLDMLKFIKFSIPSGKKIASEMIIFIFISFLSCLSFTILIYIFFVHLNKCMRNWISKKRPSTYSHFGWLAFEFKCRSVDSVDSIISAKIHDKNVDPLCHDIVSKFMIHGPCGAAKPNA